MKSPIKFRYSHHIIFLFHFISSTLIVSGVIWQNNSGDGSQRDTGPASPTPCHTTINNKITRTTLHPRFSKSGQNMYHFKITFKYTFRRLFGFPLPIKLLRGSSYHSIYANLWNSI